MRKNFKVFVIYKMFNENRRRTNNPNAMIPASRKYFPSDCETVKGASQGCKINFFPNIKIDINIYNRV